MNYIIKVKDKYVAGNLGPTNNIERALKFSSDNQAEKFANDRLIGRLNPQFDAHNQIKESHIKIEEKE